VNVVTGTGLDGPLAATVEIKTFDFGSRHRVADRTGNTFKNHVKPRKCKWRFVLNLQYFSKIIL